MRARRAQLGLQAIHRSTTTALSAGSQRMHRNAEPAGAVPARAASERQSSAPNMAAIMMTTMAAMFGALPLALGGGTGADLRCPLGITIVGGLIVSQALTLFTTPVVYLYMDRLQTWLRPARAHRPVDSPSASD